MYLLQKSKTNTLLVLSFTVAALIIFGQGSLSSSNAHAAALPASITTVPDNASIFQIGEELDYDVKFFSFRLGRIVITMDSVRRENGRNVWIAHIRMDSQEGLPFVSLHGVSEAHIDESGYTRYFLGSEKGSDGNWDYVKYLPDYPDQKITIENGKGGQISKQFDINTPYKYNDGLSLIYYARRNAAYKKYVSVPTLVQSDSGHTFINFLGERESQDIDAVNYPIDCVHFTGNASWTGAYGLTGRFEGWFSNDNARVPIRARVNLYVGSVSLELVRWNHAGWSPPVCSEK
ncbi:MAG TPA: DUF3108 domain-containing protein [Candidatus Kapabacteria bacterium]|nr:DUF3108 domain-containing protein [Candidatus Kapabacteria bacterium]